MPESIFIQVGGCGNKVGFSFWKYACQEYMNADCISDDSINHFFEPTSEWTAGSNFQDNYRARSVLVDTEENVISEGIRDAAENLFRRDQILTDSCGSENNWSVGLSYGLKHRNTIKDIIRREAESCDNLKTFILAFSLGGGTGSGIGSYILKHLSNEYGRKPSIVFPAFPSIYDDVVTSPYNAMLANNELLELPHLVIPFENLSLDNLCKKKFKRKFTALSSKGGKKCKGNSCALSSKAAVPKAGTSSESTIAEDNYFDDMNRIMSYTILDLTSSCRFSGSMNQNIVDVVANLVPYSNIHYAIPSITPLSPTEKNASSDKLVNDILFGSNQLTSHPIRSGRIYSCMLQARGPISKSELETKIMERNNPNFIFINDDDVIKIGTCDVPRIDFNRSLLQLTNTTSIAVTFTRMYGKFSQIYKEKAHLNRFMDVDNDIVSNLDEAVERLRACISEYISEAGDSEIIELIPM